MTSAGFKSSEPVRAQKWRLLDDMLKGVGNVRRIDQLQLILTRRQEGRATEPFQMQLPAQSLQRFDWITCVGKLRTYVHDRPLRTVAANVPDLCAIAVEINCR